MQNVGLNIASNILTKQKELSRIIWALKEIIIEYYLMDPQRQYNYGTLFTYWSGYTVFFILLLLGQFSYSLTDTGTIFLLPHCYWNSFQLKLDDSLQSTVYRQLFALLSCSQFCSVNPILVKVVCAVQSIYCPVYILYILHLSHTTVTFDVVLCTVGHTLVLKPWVLFTGMVLSFLVHREK